MAHLNFGPNFDYDINPKIIGRGATSEVYSATEKRTKKKRALKIINKAKVEDKYYKYLEAEVAIMKALPPHQNIVRFYETFESSSSSSSSSSSFSPSLSSPSHLCLVLELCETDLEGLILEERRFRERDCLPLMQQVAMGLHFLLLHNVCHRDLKPKNIFLKESKKRMGEWVVKLADFGLAKQTDHEDLMETAVGTPLYAAPEVVRMLPFDSRCDLWSFGAILFQMLLGRRLYNTATEASKSQFSDDPIVFPEETEHVVSPMCFDLMKRLLQKDVKNRLTWREFFAHPWLKLGHLEPIPEKKDAPPLSADSFYNSAPDSPFTLLSLLGRGKFGSVYRVEDRKSKKIRAVKVIHTKRYGKIENEIQIMSDLRISKHKCLVKLYDSISLSDGDHVLVMEFCNAGDLNGLLKQNHEKLPEEQARSLMQDFFTGVLFLKSQKISHRDLKTDNLLLKRNKEGKLKLKIGDFGLAKKLEHGDQMMQTMAGTPVYLAPEAMRPPYEYNSKSDLWSAGVVLYRVLFGKYPFMAGNRMELIGVVMNRTVEYPSSVSVSEDCMALLRSLLMKDPVERIDWPVLAKDPWLDLVPRTTQQLSHKKREVGLDEIKAILSLIQKTQHYASQFSLVMELLSTIEGLSPSSLPRHEFSKIQEIVVELLDQAAQFVQTSPPNTQIPIAQKLIYEAILDLGCAGSVSQVLELPSLRQFEFGSSLLNYLLAKDQGESDREILEGLMRKYLEMKERAQI